MDAYPFIYGSYLVGRTKAADGADAEILDETGRQYALGLYERLPFSVSYTAIRIAFHQGTLDGRDLREGRDRALTDAECTDTFNAVVA